MPFNPTDEQRQILNHNLDRHARVLAGPGTGKSATFIALLIKNAGNVRTRLLTFTRAATAELISKIEENENVECERPSTLHAFCISILLRNPGLGEFPRPLRMTDDWERDCIVEATLSRRLHILKWRVTDLFGELAANWESFIPEEAPKVTPEQRARFMGAWQQHREIFGYTLPSELPYALRTALQDHDELEGLDYRLLVVDEYQDLNSCDLEVLRELAERGSIILAAGDDDQSIYSFRKAHPAGIRRFLDDYQGASDYPLSLTQRCAKRIVAWANFVIQGDPDRPRNRPVLTATPAAPEGDVGLFSFGGETAEARGIARIAKKLIEEGRVPASEILILLRTDYHGQFSKKIKEALEREEIPFSDPSTVDELMESPRTRAIVSKLRLLMNREDSLAWATLLYLTRGIGDAFVDYIYDHARDRRITFATALLQLRANSFENGPQGSARRAHALIDETLAWLDATVVPDVTPDGGWAAWIIELFRETPSPISAELSEILTSVEERIEPTDDLGRHLSQVWPFAKDMALARSNGVRIMTLGASKGLTVRAVIIGALENGIVPKDGCELGEERRLLYVGMTRAREFLYGTWARTRRGPTARAGRAHVGQPRQLSAFLEGGPVRTQRVP